MLVRKVYYNRNTPVIALPAALLREIGAPRGCYFSITADSAKRIILTKVEAGSPLLGGDDKRVKGGS